MNKKTINLLVKKYLNIVDKNLINCDNKIIYIIHRILNNYYKIYLLINYESNSTVY